ncbi:MAG: radical SAM protein [Nanoarchaeota archaeon]
MKKIITGLKLLPGIVAVKYFGKRVPLFCQWEISYNCNMKCGFCCVNKHKKAWTPELNTKEALQVVDQLKELGTKIINFSGGEPLLRKDIDILIKHIKKKGMNVFVSTNGSVLKENADKVMDADVVRISLDNVGREHDKLRNYPNAFRKALEGMNELKKRGKKFMIHTVVTRNASYENLRRLVKLAKAFNAQIEYTMALKELQTVKNPKPEMFDKEQESLVPDREKFISDVKSLKKEFGSTVANPNIYFTMLRKGGLAEIGCRAMDITISIKPDGNVSMPCSGFPKEIMKGDIRKVWNNSKAIEARNLQGSYWFCKDCRFRCIGYPSMLVNTRALLSIASSWSGFS